MKLSYITKLENIEVDNVTLNMVKDCLEKLDLHTQPALTLTFADNHYLQCRGNNRNITIEYRFPLGDKFKHVILGKDSKNSVNVFFESPIIGEFMAKEMELFSLDETKKLFQHFYLHADVDRALNQRNITKFFR